MSRKVRILPCAVCNFEPMPIQLIYAGYDTCPTCYFLVNGKSYGDDLLKSYYKLLNPIQW